MKTLMGEKIYRSVFPYNLAATLRHSFKSEMVAQQPRYFINLERS